MQTDNNRTDPGRQITEGQIHNKTTAARKQQYSEQKVETKSSNWGPDKDQASTTWGTAADVHTGTKITTGGQTSSGQRGNLRQIHTKATTGGQTVSRQTGNIRQIHRNKDYNRRKNHIWTERQHQTDTHRNEFYNRGTKSQHKQ